MVLAAIILMAYWVVPIFSSELKLHYFLIPLTVVSLVTAAWTVLVWIFLKGIDRWPKHHTFSSTYGEPRYVVPVHAVHGSSDMGS